jgi:hypothetical protein
VSTSSTDAEPGLASPLEQRRVIRVVEIRVLRSGDVDGDHAALPVLDRLVHDDLVHPVVEGPVEAEDEADLHGILERGAVQAADRGHDDVVEVLLAAAVAFQRVVAELEGRDVRLAVRATDDLVDRLLERDRARLDELGPVVQLQEVLERLPALGVHGDEVDEFPVVLGRKADALSVRDAPHRGWVDRAAEMHVKLSELVSEGVRHLFRFASWRSQIAQGWSIRSARHSRASLN